MYDNDVDGWVYIDPVNPNIHYFKDGGEYIIDEHPTLVIGGAYSVDKWYRLQRAVAHGLSFSGWFKDEQLTEEEKKKILGYTLGKRYDFVFTHTCPYSWRPTDLFLNVIDQNTVDNSMEEFLEDIKNTTQWGVWCFGHFHADRTERPCVEQYYQDYESLGVLWDRWQNYKAGEYTPIRGEKR